LHPAPSALAFVDFTEYLARSWDYVSLEPMIASSSQPATKPSFFVGLWADFFASPNATGAIVDGRVVRVHVMDLILLGDFSPPVRSGCASALFTCFLSTNSHSAPILHRGTTCRWITTALPPAMGLALLCLRLIAGSPHRKSPSYPLVGSYRAPN